MTWSKESRQRRGYGAEWDRIRLQVLKRACGLCECPHCQGGKLRVTIATEAHHIKAQAAGGTDDMTNLQAINSDCHKREDAANRGHMLKPRVLIGLDGFPAPVK